MPPSIPTQRGVSFQRRRRGRRVVEVKRGRWDGREEGTLPLPPPPVSARVFSPPLTQEKGGRHEKGGREGGREGGIGQKMPGNITRPEEEEEEEEAGMTAAGGKGVSAKGGANRKGGREERSGGQREERPGRQREREVVEAVGERETHKATVASVEEKAPKPTTPPTSFLSLASFFASCSFLLSSFNDQS